jgi:hypothetical protein
VNLHNVKVRFRARTVHLDSHLLANLAELVTPGGLGTSSLMPLCYSKEKRILSSRLGHWGGVINFALVLLLGWTPPALLPARLVRQISPLFALFYIAVIFELGAELPAFESDPLQQTG